MTTDEDIKIRDINSGLKDGQVKCPKCGATDIETNTKTGKLRCNFCRHEFELDLAEEDADISTLEGTTMGTGAADIDQSYEDMVTVKCESCGAEVVIDTKTNTQARCHWCRNTLSINNIIPNGAIPDVILPFKVTKADAQDEIGFYASFSTYQDEDLLSIMVSFYDYLGAETPYYRAFNFSLPDGNFIDDEDLMKHFGVDEDEILTMVEDALMEDCEMTTTPYYDDVEDYGFIYNPTNYVGRILNDLWDNFDSLDHQIYIDQAGRPQFIFTQYEIVNTVPCPMTLELKANTFAKDPISIEYLRMARRLGIDPYDDSYKAFIIYLGSAYDEPSLEEALRKLQAWSDVFMDSNDPSMLVAMDSDEYDNVFINGQECYLVIPKYRNASVSIKELEITEGGELEEADNYYLDQASCAGPTFICQNISEIAPNAKITIRYRDDIFEFTPSISLKDGSLVLPDEVIDAEDVWNWEDMTFEQGYSTQMYEIIDSLIPKG